VVVRSFVYLAVKRTIKLVFLGLRSSGAKGILVHRGPRPDLVEACGEAHGREFESDILEECDTIFPGCKPPPEHYAW